MTTAAAAALI